MRVLFKPFLATIAFGLIGCTQEVNSINPQPQRENTVVITTKVTDTRYLTFARKGDLAAIMKATGHNDYPEGYADRGPETEGDADAYKWMLIAEDFGHAEAKNVVDNLLGLSSLRYDDGGLVTGQIHYDLGLDYLSGLNGLPTDFAQAKKHLHKGFAGVSGTNRDLELDRNKLTGLAREVFDSAIPAQKKKRVRQKTNSS